ncbi:MAG: ABC transporter ATP-binding protein [Lachnospiraceae bacterium]
MYKYLFLKKGKFILFAIGMCLLQAMGTGFALVLSALIDSAAKDTATVFRCLLAGLLFILVFVGVDAVYILLKNSIKKDLRVHLKSDLFTAIMKKPVSAFESSNSAEYLNDFNNNLGMYETLYYDNLLMIPALFLQFGIAAAVCISLEPMMLLLMVVLAFVTLLSTKFTSGMLEKGSQGVVDASEAYLTEIKDDFAGYRTIRNFGILSLIFGRHKKMNETMEQAKYSLANNRMVCECVGELVGLGSTVLVMGVAAYYASKGVFSAGLVIAFGQLIGHIISPINQMPSVIANYRASKPLTKRFRELLEETPEEKGTEKTSFDTEIRMQDVSFSYEENRVALAPVTAVFEKGKKYAVVGESGCGKSTLFHLLTGCYKNYKGSLSVDGTEISGLKDASLQQLMGVVSQDTFLFHDTLYNNITMFRDGFSDDEVQNAIEKAGLSGFVEKLTEGMQTVISENGKNLSGGEKQRIGLARVLLNRNPIMLFDEPTANLDEKNSKDIENHILSIPDKTVIMITHKTDAETLKRFDEVVQIG